MKGQFLTAVRELVDAMNRQSASGLITRQMIVHTLSVERMLSGIERDTANGERDRAENIDTVAATEIAPDANAEPVDLPGDLASWRG